MDEKKNLTWQVGLVLALLMGIIALLNNYENQAAATRKSQTEMENMAMSGGH